MHVSLRSITTFLSKVNAGSGSVLTSVLLTGEINANGVLDFAIFSNRAFGGACHSSASDE